jgi:adenylate cyclase
MEEQMASAKNLSLIHKILSIGSDPDDTLETSLLKRLLVTGSLALIAATTVWGTVFVLLDEPLAGAISLAYAAVTVLSLILFSYNHRYERFRAVQLTLGLFLPFIQMLALGGFANSGAVILWSLISPLGALLLYEKPSHLWSLGFIGLVTASGFLEPYLRAENNLPPSLITALFVMNILVIAVIAILTLRYFIHQKNTAYRLLRIEEEKAENLLLNILPPEIAAILKNEQRTIADQFEGVSILFADLVGFTPLTAQMAPVEMVNLLNEIFSYFDSLVDKYNLEKIRTIGDSYMAAAGVPRPQSDHAHTIACFALDMRRYLEERFARTGQPIEFRIGINSGPVVGGVIGRKKFVYDIWGDAVNIASRMESHGVPGAIQISNSTYELIKNAFICEPRGSVEVKGRGPLDTWFLVGPKKTAED